MRKRELERALASTKRQLEDATWRLEDARLDNRSLQERLREVSSACVDEAVREAKREALYRDALVWATSVVPHGEDVDFFIAAADAYLKFLGHET